MRVTKMPDFSGIFECNHSTNGTSLFSSPFPSSHLRVCRYGLFFHSVHSQQYCRCHPCRHARRRHNYCKAHVFHVWSCTRHWPCDRKDVWTFAAPLLTLKYPFCRKRILSNRYNTHEIYYFKLQLEKMLILL